MKISDIKTILMTVPLAAKDVLRWSGGNATAISVTLVRVHTDQGVTGLGDVYCGMLVPEVIPPLVEHFKRQLLGADPLQIQGLWNSMYRRSLFWGRSGIAMAVMGSIENALWDIAGKVAGVPVYELLGGLAHQRLPIYASGGLDKSPEDMVAELDGYKSDGFKAVKIRIGHGLKKDCEKVSLAREVLGDEIELMVDAVQGHNPVPWAARTASGVARRIEEFNVAWFEEPCLATDYAGYAEVRRSTKIPIAGGESSAGIHEFIRFFETQSLDIVQPDVSHAGGILECKKIAALAEANSVRLAPHSWGSAIVLAANFHFGFSTPNCWILEYPTWGFPLRDELLVEPVEMKDGYIYPSRAPGLGVELREEIIAKYPYQPGSSVEMRRTSGT